MNVLAVGSKAKAFTALTLNGERITPDFSQPTVLCFAMPQVHSSRLVVGYLRRLQTQLADLTICILLQGSEETVSSYSQGYLDQLKAVHDNDLFISGLYEVSHIATTYFMEDNAIKLAFSGFNRNAMNNLAALAAQAYDQPVKELITTGDNKGDYELAERGLR
jgi:hypothetical protein